MTDKEFMQADEWTEHEALATERSRIINQREHRVATRQDATSESERRAADVLENAEHRDLVANARDSAANRRDMQANLDAFLNDDNDEAPFEARELARKDRDASRRDRSASAVDRSELAAKTEPAGDEEDG
jgi:hypothetical protein